MGKIKIHDLHRISSYIKKDLDQAYQNTLDESCYLRGSSVKEFETQWSDYTGAEDCCAVTSGTDALHTAAMIAELKPGDEVIMPGHGFIASIGPFAHTGASIKYVDSKLSDYCINEDAIEECITDKTKAIVWIDINGQTPDIDKIIAIAKKHNIMTIEDAAPSAGASYKNNKVGSLADITCFSFGPVKPLGAIGGAGGITASKTICDRARQLRDHGRIARDQYKTLGWNRNMHSLQASFLLAKLPYLDELNDRKRTHALEYNNALEGIVKHIPQEQNETYHPYHLYSVLVEKRNELREYLNAHNVESLIHWPVGLHEYSFSTKPDKELPITKQITTQSVSLPCSPFLTVEERNQVIDLVRKFYA